MLKKLVVLQDVKLQIPGMSSIWMTGEDELFTVVQPTEVINKMMGNPLFVEQCQQMGATHWELSDVPTKVENVVIPTPLTTYHLNDLSGDKEIYQ